MINVTKPNLPPLEEYVGIIKGIWDRNWLTNNGPLVNELELRLKEYLDVKHILYLNNGTIALQFAFKALDLTPNSEIITTPFSFIATTSSIVWEGFKPVFVDIDENTLNINPDLIEASITEHTTAILATHVFGNPCNIDAIDKIAKKHKLKVIYDAAHCFGTKYKGRSVFEFGDISTTSFHATKLFHTIEGGAVFTQNPELLKKMSYMRNFGYNGPEDFECVGLNGKNSEFHAAMGLCNLPLVDDILKNRKKLSLIYNSYLESTGILKFSIQKDAEFNFAYYPILLDNEQQVTELIAELNGNHIYPRRYFYPSLNTVKYSGNQSANVSEKISKQILCLPLYYNMTKEDVNFVSRIVLRTLKY